MSKKVLITGYKGFIGSNLQKLTGWDGVDLPETDIRNIGQLFDIVEGYDVVIHLAALAGVKSSIENELDYVDTNVVGTYNLAHVCWRHDIRLIFASSSSVYEARSPYARTKKGGEDIIGAFTRHGLDACILRFFTVFGENNRTDMAVYKFIQAIDKGEPINLYGDCWRDFTYVQDLCKAIQKVVKKDTKGTWDAGFGEPVSVMGLITLLENIIGKQAEVRQEPQRDFDPRITKADPELMKHLGIKQTPIKEALQNTVADILGKTLPEWL